MTRKLCRLASIDVYSLYSHYRYSTMSTQTISKWGSSLAFRLPLGHRLENRDLGEPVPAVLEDMSVESHCGFLSTRRRMASASRSLISRWRGTRLVTISVGPDVVVPASSEEPPARAGEPFLEIAAFHARSVHESGFIAVRGLRAGGWAGWGSQPGYQLQAVRRRGSGRGIGTRSPTLLADIRNLRILKP